MDPRFIDEIIRQALSPRKREEEAAHELPEE
jgi:hypothetical protein